MWSADEPAPPLSRWIVAPRNRREADDRRRDTLGRLVGDVGADARELLRGQEAAADPERLDVVVLVQSNGPHRGAERRRVDETQPQGDGADAEMLEQIHPGRPIFGYHAGRGNETAPPKVGTERACRSAGGLAS